jgi:hypothetical protein
MTYEQRINFYQNANLTKSDKKKIIKAAANLLNIDPHQLFVASAGSSGVESGDFGTIIEGEFESWNYHDDHIVGWYKLYVNLLDCRTNKVIDVWSRY